MPELEDPTIRIVNLVQLGRAVADPALQPPLVVNSGNPAAIAPSQNAVLESLRRMVLVEVSQAGG